MASRLIMKAAAVVLLALGYCSLCHCKGRHVIPPMTLKDVFISVKTTRHNQNTRLPIILKTWFQLAKDQIWFFTDIDHSQYQNLTKGHMVNTNCPASYSIFALCCKTGFEYDLFLKSSKRWFCYFEDDNYVNVPRLLSLLQKYDHNEYWYLGRTTENKPMTWKIKSKNYTFKHATRGAGYCLSRSMALKLLPIIGGGKLKIICQNIGLADDVTLAFIIHLLGLKLTEIPKFHSHYEHMRLLDRKLFKDQISFSYNEKKTGWNIIDVPGFNTKDDPTRFLSLHCYLYPHSPICPKHIEAKNT